VGILIKLSFMKVILSIFLITSSSIVGAQMLTGIWHGKIYDNNNEPTTYVNVSFNESEDQQIAHIRYFDKSSQEWLEQKHDKINYISLNSLGILSILDAKEKSTESKIYLFSFIDAKRVAVEWISQIKDLNDSDNLLIKKGFGYLEPFYNGKIYENLSIGGTSTNRVSIDKVEIAKEVTVVTFSYHNTSFDQVLMRLSKPGEVGAYYITPADRSKKYYITDKDNIAFEPDNTLVRPNSYHTFKIYFEPLPETLTSFSILEGNPETQTGKEWNFYDIQLK